MTEKKGERTDKIELFEGLQLAQTDKYVLFVDALICLQFFSGFNETSFII